MSNLNFTLAGVDLPLLETLVKDREDGRTYHCFRKPTSLSGYSGVVLPALTEELPTSITIDGVEIPMTVGLSPASYTKKGVTTIVPEDERRQQATAVRVVTLPSIGEERNVDAKVTLRVDGTWNVKITVNRAGTTTVSPEERAKTMAKKGADNLALIRALMSV